MEIKRKAKTLSSYYRESSDFATLINYRILRAGHIITAPDFFIKRDSVAGHEFIFCLRGNGWIGIQANKFKVNAGELVWLPVRLPHEHYPDRDNPWEIQWIRVDGDKLNNVMNFLNITDKPVFQVKKDRDLAEIFAALFAQMQESTLIADIQCDILLAKLIFMMIESRNDEIKTKPNNIHRSLHKLIFHIQSHYNDEWDIPRFMRYCQVSKSQLFTLFNMTFHQSPMKWLKNYRLSQSKRLLVDTGENIATIAQQVGYNDPLHFSRDFRKATGVSPSDFRKQEKLLLR